MLVAPYLEESALADRYRPAAGIGIGAIENRAVVSESPAIFRCPSDGGPLAAFLALDEAGGPHASGAMLGRSSYVANAGHAEPWAEPLESWEGQANGPLYRNSWLKLARISDGLSKTVFLGEHSQRLSQKAWAGTLPGTASHPSEAFATLAGSEPDRAATLLLVHSGPADGEAKVISTRRTIRSPTSARCFPITPAAATWPSATGPCGSSRSRSTSTSGRRCRASPAARWWPAMGSEPRGIRPRRLMTPRRARLLPLVLRTVMVLLVVMATTVAGCRPRAPKIEFANRRYSAALRTAANTKSPERLAKAKDLIVRDRAAGAIGLEEHAWYEEIIALAEAGRWADAERRAIDFRRDQRR